MRNLLIVPTLLVLTSLTGCSWNDPFGCFAPQQQCDPCVAYEPCCPTGGDAWPAAGVDAGCATCGPTFPAGGPISSTTPTPTLTPGPITDAPVQ